MIWITLCRVDRMGKWEPYSYRLSRFLAYDAAGWLRAGGFQARVRAKKL